jgi:hypothetical protein
MKILIFWQPVPKVKKFSVLQVATQPIAENASMGYSITSSVKDLHYC